MILDQDDLLEQQWIEWLRCTFQIRDFTSHDPDTVEWALIGTPDTHYSMLIDGTFPYRCCIRLRYSTQPFGWGFGVASVSCGRDVTSQWYRYDGRNAHSWRSRGELCQRLQWCLPEMRRTEVLKPTHSDTQLIEQIMLILSAWEYFVDELDQGVTHEKSPTTGRHS